MTTARGERRPGSARPREQRGDATDAETTGPHIGATSRSRASERRAAAVRARVAATGSVVHGARRRSRAARTFVAREHDAVEVTHIRTHDEHAQRRDVEQGVDVIVARD